MSQRNNKIDHYIDGMADFAKPILEHFRSLVLNSIPEIQEELKWSAPAFIYGKSILFSMAGFKQHVRIGFWIGGLLEDKTNVFLDDDCNSSMRFLRNVKSIEDLPEDKILIDLIKQSVQKNQEGAKSVRNYNTEKTELVIPEYFTESLKNNLLAHDNFQNFTPGKKREYVNWITEAKTESTRNSRMQTAIEWISEGKARNWKYEKC